MDDPTTREEVFELIRNERRRLDSALEGIDRSMMLQPDVEADWSIKDILAHIVDWEGRMTRWIDETLRGEVPQRPEPGMTWDELDLLNAKIYAENKDRALEDILAEYEASYQEALEAVERLSEADLFAPDRFAWRKSDPMWHMVAANTWWHYKDHAEAIQAWSQAEGAD